MKTVVIMNEKGGVGKTTIVAHAAWFFAEKHRTLVIDLDQQANLSATLSDNLALVQSVELFAHSTKVISKGPLTVSGSTRDLLEIDTRDETPIEEFRQNLSAMNDDYDVCVVDTPPALTNRTFAAILAADAILAPIGIDDYSLSGITELLRAIKGISAFYKREEPLFLGLLPSIFDRKSRHEREMFESLAGQVGKLLFPGIIAKRDSYRRAATAQIPVWSMKGASAQEAGSEIRGILALIEQRLELAA